MLHILGIDFVVTSLIVLLLVSSVAALPQDSASSGYGFPNNFVLSSTAPPTQSRDDWWCDQLYGFLGFSYPLENDDCSDPSNSYEKINADFARMKSQFGATMVRIYAPECREESVWMNILRAGITNNIGVIVQVWWGFESQHLWKQTQASILAVLEDCDLGAFAPYVFHSLSFGSEPIGDNVDGGPQQFIADLRAMKSDLAPYDIPISISEDWNRPGSMSVGNFAGLGPIGTEIAAVIDLVHAHIMPYYDPHAFPSAYNIWPYFEKYIAFLKKNLSPKQILVTETMWSSQVGGTHDRGSGNPGENMNNFQEYWSTLSNQCNFFKANGVGWFVHTYDDTFEIGFGMIGSNGKPKMNFHPPKC